MRITKVILQSAALIALVMPATYAKQAAPDTNPATINQRKENQQDRIASGVKDSELTAGETRNLETKEADLNKEEHNMRAADDGKLTAGDRAKIQHQQNKLSRQIYNRKHNARVQ